MNALTLTWKPNNAYSKQPWARLALEIKVLNQGWLIPQGAAEVKLTTAHSNRADRRLHSTVTYLDQQGDKLGRCGHIYITKEELEEAKRAWMASIQDGKEV
ncbi:hypothetical protein NLI96_g12475 [Meripilus lineatus]|uniref:Uncharacterized protein n=1 Tax=Meripilus lineatus TaxID=2056292 RepID=A0AAD5UUJ0_9APHY|nr:hypothetical protein NLI96_g12475 [Physisporinus lineatus]